MKTMRALYLSLFVCVLVLLAPGTSMADFSDNFNNGDACAWDEARGTWEVVDSEYVGAAGGALDTFIGDPSWSSYTFEVRMRIESNADNDFGLIFYAQGADNFLRFTVRLGEIGWILPRITHVENRSSANELATSLPLNDVEIQRGGWYTIKVVLDGDSVKAYVNDVLVAEAANNLPFTQGYVGLSADNARVYYDDVVVTGVDDLPPGSCNQAPTADAGEDQTIDCGQEVILDGSGSSDPDGDPLMYTWEETGKILGPGELFKPTLAPGVHTITLTVEDDSGESDTDTIVITINGDIEPPTITLITDQITLWPANHKYETINVSDLVASVSGNCEALEIDDVIIFEVTSDEVEDAKGKGDGNTKNDIAFFDDGMSVDLRAERQGGGNGRVYTIHLAIVDSNGNIGTAACLVQIPHDKWDTAVDDGEIYSVNWESP